MSNDGSRDRQFDGIFGKLFSARHAHKFLSQNPNGAVLTHLSRQTDFER
jgi:hypothetical protein